MPCFTLRSLIVEGKYFQTKRANIKQIYYFQLTSPSATISSHLYLSKITMFTNIVRMDYAGAILYRVRHRGACTAHTHLQ